MAVPQTKIYIAFSLTSSGQNYFLLNDSVKGVLNSTYVLGGTVEVYSDVTNYVASVSVNRGKSRDLDRYTAGSSTVILHNDSRIFDPFNAAGSYYGNILPRKKIIIETNGNRIFSGYIDDWDFSYDLSGKSYATVSALDGFLLLSAAELSTFTTTSELSSTRINTILNRPEVNWPLANRSIQTGTTTLQNDVVSQGDNALGYLQLVETTENGMLFMNRSGSLTFKNRVTTPSPTEITFADDATSNAIKYSNVGVVYGSENFYNRVNVQRLNGTDQTVDSASSQTLYGISSLNLGGLLLTTDAEALNLANYLLGIYDQPELRINQITVNLHNKTPDEVAKLTTAEIGDTVKIRFTPNQVGSVIAQNAIIIGVSQGIEIDQHQVTFTLGRVAFFPFILDDAIFGLLDSGILAY
jgi:hypothetical protein